MQARFSNARIFEVDAGRCLHYIATFFVVREFDGAKVPSSGASGESARLVRWACSGITNFRPRVWGPALHW